MLSKRYLCEQAVPFGYRIAWRERFFLIYYVTLGLVTITPKNLARQIELCVRLRSYRPLALCCVF